MQRGRAEGGGGFFCVSPDTYPQGFFMCPVELFLSSLVIEAIQLEHSECRKDFRCKPYGCLIAFTHFVMCLIVKHCADCGL